ncbi:hypothetical protein ABH927_000938 [Planotetraspora sp. GP83]
MRKLWLVAVVFMAVSCGETPAPQPDGAVGVPASSGAPSAEPSPATPVGNTLKAHKVPWISATPTDSSLNVVWWSGVEPCYVLDRVEVTETKDAVTVTLWEGHDRRKPDAVCIEIAIQKQTTVKLSAPLGTRKVIDGAK